MCRKIPHQTRIPVQICRGSNFHSLLKRLAKQFFSNQRAKCRSRSSLAVKLKRKSKCMRENRTMGALQIDSSSAFSIKRHTPAVSHFSLSVLRAASKTDIVRHIHAPGRVYYLTSGQINEYKSTCTDTGCALLFLIGLSSFTRVDVAVENKCIGTNPNILPACTLQTHLIRILCVSECLSVVHTSCGIILCLSLEL